MTERPILFSGEMVNAILAGNKTQTRRVIRPQPTAWEKSPDILAWKNIHCPPEGLLAECPYGRPGDRLWVRETWGFSAKLPASTKDELSWIAYAHLRGYRADGHDGYCWRPSIFMPRWASRITLGIVNIRVERIQSISEDDAAAEGLVSYESEKQPGVIHWGLSRPDVWETDPCLTYKRLWDSINAKRGFPWLSNPWVWVIEFNKIS